MREMARGIDTRPYAEWLDGEQSIAVSPNTPHGIVAMTLAQIINRQGERWGFAVQEVHLRLDDDPVRKTVLLPDVAYFRTEQLTALTMQDRLLPNVPPELIAEVRSPSDRPGFRDEKIRRYLAWGCPLVLDVDPSRRSITVHSAAALRPGDRFSDLAVPWLTFDVGEVFARLESLGF